MKDYSHPQVRYWSTISGMLWWCAAGLGVACLIDTMHQSFSYGAWLPFRPLYYFYYPVLTAYAGSREREKWVRQARQYEQYTGEFFVYAWLALALFIFADNSLGYAAAWPPSLTQTLTVILSVYLGVKFIGGFRPGMDVDPAPAPSPTPSPNPIPGPTPMPDDPDDPGPNPDPTDPPNKPELAAQIRQACQAAGTFTSQDIAQQFGLSVPQARGYIIQLLIEGVVAKLGHDHFSWKG